MYIAQTIKPGSTVIVCEVLPPNLVPTVTYVVVANSVRALGLLAANFNQHPATKLKLVAVTGTSGKTTTVTLLYKLFKQLGYRVGLLSTICNKIDE